MFQDRFFGKPVKIGNTTLVNLSSSVWADGLVRGHNKGGKRKSKKKRRKTRNKKTRNNKKSNKRKSRRRR